MGGAQGWAAKLGALEVCQQEGSVGLHPQIAGKVARLSTVSAMLLLGQRRGADMRRTRSYTQVRDGAPYLHPLRSRCSWPAAVG